MNRKIVNGLMGLAIVAGGSMPQISTAENWGAILSEAMSDPEITAGMWIDAEPSRAIGPAPLDMRFASDFLEEQGLPPFQIHWDFGDGSSSTDREVEHRYENVGEYFVGLVVIDAQGKRIESRKRILVTKGENETPFANIEAIPGYVRSGEVVTLDGSASGDKDGTLVAFEWMASSGSNPVTIENSDQPVTRFVMPENIGLAGVDVELKVTDNQGEYVRRSINIPVLGAMGIGSDRRKGLSPLDVMFEIKVNTDTPISNYTMDFEGDGKIDKSSDTSDGFSHRYEQPGDYTVYATARTADGETFSNNIKIVVLPKEYDAANMKARWLEMATEVKNGNMNAGMKFFAEPEQPMLQMMVTRLDPEDLKRLVNNELSDLYVRSINSFFADSIVWLRSETGEEISLPVKWIQDEQGDWYILSLM